MHSQEGEGEPQEASLKKGVPTYEFDSRISPAAVVPHEEKELCATKKSPHGTPLIAHDTSQVRLLQHLALEPDGLCEDHVPELLRR